MQSSQQTPGRKQQCLERRHKPFSHWKPVAYVAKPVQVMANSSVYTYASIDRMVLFLHISGFVSYSRFCSWGHLLWQKSYAAHVWLWMRPSSSNPWWKLNYNHDSVFSCKNIVYMQRAVGGGAGGESDSQVCAVGVRMHPHCCRRGRAVSRYRVSMASWCDWKPHAMSS